MKRIFAMGAISVGIILVWGVNQVWPTTATPTQQQRAERSAYADEMMRQAPEERVARVQAEPHRDAHLEAPLMVRPDRTALLEDRSATCKRADLEWPTWRDNVLGSNPGTDFFELRADGRDELLEVLGCADSGNNCPPDEVMVFHSTGNTNVLIAYIKQGCVIRAKEISTEDYMSYVTGGHTVELRKFQSFPPFVLATSCCPGDALARDDTF